MLIPVVDPLRSLLRASHLLAPDDLASTVAAHARAMGAREIVLYLADYEQATLVGLCQGSWTGPRVDQAAAVAAARWSVRASNGVR